MISWFTYDAFFPVVTGGILAIVFFFLFIMSREKIMLYISLGIAMLVGLVFVCEQLIVTDREEIEAIVYQLSNEVRSNNVEGVVTHISKARKDTIDRARSEMPRYFFDECRLTGVNSFEDVAGKPNTKKIVFTVVFRVSLLPDRTKIPGQRRVELTFEKDASGQWKITTYAHSDPRSGVRL
jgi:hypothetical protein